MNQESIIIRRESGRSPCGERGLKSLDPAKIQNSSSRSPCGERGLKYKNGWKIPQISASLPVRGAWIEIVRVRQKSKSKNGRSPCGERGLKSPAAGAPLVASRRSPCGERGLKSICDKLKRNLIRRSPCGERGLKCAAERRRLHPRESLPVRGAWIEIETHCADSGGGSVAPRAGSVD